MGLERVRIALLRGFDIPRGLMQVLEWVAEPRGQAGTPPAAKVVAVG
jgi:hypothetical protein